MEAVKIKGFQVLPDLHRRVLGAIPSSRQNAIAINYLMEKLSINQSERRRMNQVINELIFDYGYPIGTSSEEATKGIFFIENEDDLSLACHTLNSRAMGALKRHKKIIQNFNSLNRDQLEADL